MLFNSFEFLIFYPVVLVIYFILSQRFRWLWLLAASCYFYMFFKPVYIVILAGTILIDYYAGLQLGKLAGRRKKLMLIVSICANVGVLAVFKYYNFFVENINGLFGAAGSWFTLKYLDILLPIGLSFHTFQAMSYTIEVYRGKQKPEKHLGIYALYVMFYPQLVAGPIERPQNIMHQFHVKHAFSTQNLSYGLKLMLWGFFKKLFVADRLAAYVGSAYSNYINQSGSTLLLASMFFAFQIYCDFSAYSDIARGVAKTMGFDLLINFRRPYLATNISDFWRRWHISLSSWFKDYLYFPLGGNKTSLFKWCRNIMVVFLLSGLWHGANWTYVIWGALHGLFTIVHKLVSKTGKTSTGGSRYVVVKAFSIIATFIMVTFAWVFFRAETVHQAIGIIHKIVTNPQGKLFIKTNTWMLLSWVGIAAVVAADVAEEYNLSIKLLHSKWFAVRFATISLLVMTILVFGVFQNTSFIYFQF